MSKDFKHWELIIEQYKLSGLSQVSFCKENNLSYNQFQYRWCQYNTIREEKIKRNDTQHAITNTCFESINIISSSVSVRDKTKLMTELSIHLPNKIRCDVSLDLNQASFGVLLKQLVSLC